MSKKSTITRNWPRYLLQWGTLALLVFFLSGLAGKIFQKSAEVNPEAYCPFGGIQALTTYAVRGSLPCSMTTLQIMMGIALLVGIILFSKLFCGYLCPVGTVQDLLAKLRKGLKIKELSIRNGSVLDKALRIVKYLLLFWIVYMTATSSELFCKNLDPYYAVATGFKGEITLWMSIVTIAVTLIGAFLVDQFWCRYICPLGAASNTFKFWLWIAGLFALWFVLNKIGLALPWFVLLGLFCLIGYLLEVFCAKPKMQILHIVKDDAACTDCGLCTKNCPYHIDVAACKGKVNHVDCTLCGECVASCNRDALRVGVTKKSDSKKVWKIVPALLTVLLVILGFCVGNMFELPTINETWGEPKEIETVEVKNLRSVKCYGSSMAFKARLERIVGTCGVKTYVGKHRVIISYDPTVISAEKIQEEIFVPSKFRVNPLDPQAADSIKVVTIRTEKMGDKTDLNYLGLQMRLTGKKIYGLESEYDCPLIVRVFMDPTENLDKAWFKEIVEKKVLAMPVHGGGVKETPVDYDFVKLEDGERFVPVADYLNSMFDPFQAEYRGKYPTAEGDTVIRKRAEVYEGEPQFIYEIVDRNYEKPIVLRALPFLSNHISREEGVIGTYLRLNKDLLPSLQIRYAAPMTEARLWELMTMDKWTITYSADDVRVESARLEFDTPGTSYPIE